MDNGLSLSVRDLTVAGDRGRSILSLDRLVLEPGVALGVQGPSGAGKSTLIFALAGLAASATGSVRWGETDLLSLSARRTAAFRARNIGLIFQDFLLFDELGAEDNASVQSLFAPRGRRPGLREQAGAMLDRLKVPKASRTVASYSGGERQRVSVARALAHEPAIVLADEPTASLHRAAADALTDDLLADVRARGRTLIVASHDERLLSRMDRRLHLADGTVREAA
ncbi:ABC transporter ATP-binding protein [Histidinibacterium aquaticum]|uniref:ATP-binding cassette domain-containing protein n=1 Tax=Histidinibacterium aquaticum TaxID=2613962 RepID=A0A5J5GDE3_9RHOB|nr:ATP-binding cassette domain-containing protein [Histidinibacterium aquaticum]KAA9005958.1 ATP-binding cassette domain-containing protein [Histidinibacterium aquaticum]